MKDQKIILNWKIIAGLSGGIIIALVWKFALLYTGVFPFNSDEAIVGLMARHILNGELPIFFYGQAYMGSLDAFLVSAGFLIFGESVQAIRYIQIFLYCGVLLTTFWLSSLVLRSYLAALISVFLLSIPTINMTLYTTVSLGGYVEALLIGNLILCIGFLSAIVIKGENNFKKSLLLLIGWGFLAGLGLWANGITLVFSIPVGAFLAYTIWQHEKTSKGILLLVSVLIGSIIGATPWLVYAVQNSPSQLMQELFGSAVAVEGGSWIAQVFAHTVSFILLGIPVTLGLRPPWEVRWLVLPMIPFVLFFWILVIRFGKRSKFKTTNDIDWFRLVLASVAACLILMFIFTHFGVDPSGRYFLPLSIVLAVFGGDFIDRGIIKKIWKWMALCLIISFQLIGTIQCMQRNPPGITTQFDASAVVDHLYDNELINFLKSKNETRGYSNYWVSYPLAFLSQEELIFTPKLPYHQDLRYTSRDDRYPPYGEIVTQSERTTLITTKNPSLDKRIRALLLEKKMEWKEKVIGDYRVFYALTAIIQESDFHFLDQP